jgi:hypothetical protein
MLKLNVIYIFSMTLTEKFVQGNYFNEINSLVQYLYEV